jgi:DNA-binding NarL/FixJ family response regulator
MMLRILVVDDNASFREAFSQALNYQPDLEVVAQAGSLAEARANQLEGIDVASIDRRLPDGDGLELIGDLREASSGAKVFMMSAVMEPVQPREAQKVGVEGVIDKIASPEEIAAQIRALRAV